MCLLQFILPPPHWLKAPQWIKRGTSSIKISYKYPWRRFTVGWIQWSYNGRQWQILVLAMSPIRKKVIPWASSSINEAILMEGMHGFPFLPTAAPWPAWPLVHKSFITMGNLFWVRRDHWGGKEMQLMVAHLLLEIPLDLTQEIRIFSSSEAGGRQAVSQIWI